MSTIVEALNTPGLSLWKNIAMALSFLGIGMDLYNITMYYIYSRVYLAPNPILERA